MAITNFVRTESDRAVCEELNGINIDCGLYFFLRRTVASRRADCCRSWLLWMALCGVDVRVMLIHRARSESYACSMQPCSWRLGPLTIISTYKETVYCSLLLCICMLFVLGTAEEQFVTDAVFLFQYQYQWYQVFYCLMMSSARTFWKCKVI